MHLASPSPYEPLDRRWLRAGWLLEHGLRPAPMCDDRWVEQAVLFRTALNGCRDEAEHQALAEAMPDLYQAYLLHQADSPVLRWAVEARILSGEPFADNACKCALLPEALVAFEALFFAVMDKLHAETWVTCQVLGPRAIVGLTEQDVGTWWKMLGYGLGPLVLDIVIRGGLGLPRSATTAELDETLATAASTLFALKRLHATYLVPVTPDNALQILQVAADMDVLRPREQSREEDPVAAFWTGVLQQRLAAPVTTVPDEGSGQVISLPPASYRDVEPVPPVREAV